MKTFRTALIIGASLLLCVATPGLHAADVEIDDTLAGVPLGIGVASLKTKYPTLYSHKLKYGEVLHESCNQGTLDVFTFTEEPWSPGRITYIWLRRETDPTVCRDSAGSLPDLQLDPATSRGVRIGDPKAKVIKEYGKPKEEKSLDSGVRILKYPVPPPNAQSGLEDVVLFFNVRNEIVEDISVSGKVPGAKAPY